MNKIFVKKIKYSFGKISFITKLSELYNYFKSLKLRKDDEAI